MNWFGGTDTTSGIPTYYGYFPTTYPALVAQQEEERKAYAERRFQELTGLRAYVEANASLPSPSSPIPSNTLTLLKKSVREIVVGAVSEEMRGAINNKIEKLRKLGVKKQADVLEAELALRTKLARVKEWNYPVLPYDELMKFDRSMVGGFYLKVHIDKLADYVGNTSADVDVKDSIIPDFALEKLEEAKDRQVFDDFAVLWVEKVKDPLLLGLLQGCKDYFFICEWGEDVKFEDIVKEKEQKK